MNTHKELLSECCSAKPLDELAYDNSGRCGDCKEGCMFVAECETSCGVNADPADGFGRCTCGNERLEPTPPSQIEEEPTSNYVRVIPGTTKEFVKEVIECDFCKGLYRWSESHTCGSQPVVLEAPDFYDTDYLEKKFSQTEEKSFIQQILDNNKELHEEMMRIIKKQDELIDLQFQEAINKLTKEDK